ncbi:MAG TPA: hypothetical protein VMS88_08940 [Terriglobales bacterium]|nr:hypothetical protein [Terriglobales bacterium]
MTTAEAWGARETYAPSAHRRLLADVFRQRFRVLRAGGQLSCWLGTRCFTTATKLGEAADLRYRRVSGCDTTILLLPSWVPVTIVRSAFDAIWSVRCLGRGLRGC